MAASKEDPYRLALELTDADRAALAGMLLESLESGEYPEVESGWLAEIDRRVAELDSGAVQPVSWAPVRDRLRRKSSG